MTPDRAHLIRSAAATAAQALRVQGAAGHRGYSEVDIAQLLGSLGDLAREVSAASSVDTQTPSRSVLPTPAPSAQPPSSAAPRALPVTAATPPLPRSDSAAAPVPTVVSPARPPSTQRVAGATSASPASMPAVSASTGPAPWNDAAPVRETSAPEFDLGAMLATGADGLARVRRVIGDCRRCGLCASRTNIVFGVGNPSARILFVGEGPDEEEDRLGEPFVGPSGELLNRMIVAMGLRRDEVYITNVVKCLPPQGREPSQLEVARCRGFLQAQIAAVSPEVIVALGRSAISALSGKPMVMRATRGKWLELEGIGVMPTYHPSFILRLRDDELRNARRDAWSDLQAVMARLGLQPPNAKR